MANTVVNSEQPKHAVLRSLGVGSVAVSLALPYCQHVPPYHLSPSRHAVSRLNHRNNHHHQRRVNTARKDDLLFFT